MNIKRIVSEIKKESWYAKLDAVNRLGNITYEELDDAEYVLRNLLIELEFPKTIMQVRILWAVNNIITQYPEISYKVIPHLLRISNSENKAVSEIVTELLNRPVMKYAIKRYGILLSKDLHSKNSFLKLEAMMNVWKMAPVTPELIDSILPEIIESTLEKNNLKIGIYSWLILESEDNKTIDEIADLVNQVYLHLDLSASYSPSHIKKLISSPDLISKFSGLVLLEKNPEIVNNEIIEDILKIFTAKNISRYLKVRLFLTLGVLSKDKPYLKNIIINEANNILQYEKDWLIIFGALVGYYIIGEKVTNNELLTHDVSLIRAISVQLMDSKNIEKALNMLSDSHIISYVSTIDRFTKPDINEDLKLKFLNELSNPWNYPYINKNVDDEALLRIKEGVSSIANSWSNEHWVSKINLMNDIAQIAVNNPEYIEQSLELIIKSIEDKFGLVRAQGLWIVRAILSTESYDRFKILEKLDSYLDPKLKINDPNVFVRLNYVLLLRSFSNVLKDIEGSNERISEIIGHLVHVSLNDEIKIVSEVSNLILKYDFNFEIDKSYITIEHMDEILKAYPYASTGIFKYLVKKYQNDSVALKRILKSSEKYLEYGCDFLCIVNGMNFENNEIFEITKNILQETSPECTESVKSIINTYLEENNWKTRLNGLYAIKNISKMDIKIIEIFILKITEIALFDRIFELRNEAGNLLKKLQYEYPEISRKTSVKCVFKPEPELLKIIKENGFGVDEALCALNFRKDEVSDIESLIMVISKVRNSEKWFRRVYAYKLLENVLKLEQIENYHYEIINWCLEGQMEQNPLISKISKSILEKLGRTTETISSKKTVSDRIRKIGSLLESGDWSVKVEALQSLQDFINEGHYGYLDLVMDKLDDPHWKVKNTALGILADIDPDLIKPAIPKVISLLKDGDESVILKTLLTIKKFGQRDSKIIEKVMPMLDELENYGTWSIKEEIMRLKLAHYHKARQKH
ncbi:conserved hypothetical protein [Methanococcus vannielii SB]|uniref:HEAT domain containing protein n=1 Tax=Methanococcus vannielii (strain ATCC 35089 / DSM 1224 / JCM 13029 / OCM 148 / SB) TaxID=406327 RepID=A6UP43_METVS|nr:HEAT repeat domain-containing protein [Methanococcus vannielii]ABR54265.1 conserved hypothetical protein [Methanococcus vannielii SB]